MVDKEDSSPDDQIELKIQGPIRRNWALLTGIVAIMLIAPSISRVLQVYRAVVLEVQDEKMFLGFRQRPPKWVDAITANQGDVINKDAGSWDPKVVPPLPADQPPARSACRRLFVSS